MPPKNDRYQDCDESQQAPLLQLTYGPASPVQLHAWRQLWSRLLSAAETNLEPRKDATRRTSTVPPSPGGTVHGNIGDASTPPSGKKKATHKAGKL
jgi:hypothetical protein